MKRLLSAIVAAMLVASLALLGAACSGTSEATEHNNRGVELLNGGKWEEAIAELDMAIELNPSSAKAYSNRGYAHRELEQYEQALADFDKAIELEPDYAGAYLNRGATYFDLEQFEQAVADYGKAIELDPDSALTYANRGSAYAALGQEAQAKADYEKALPLASDPALAAHIHESLDRLATAWPSEWEAGVCGAYAELREEVDARGSALDLARTCPETGDCTDAALAAEEAAGHADTMIALLEGVPAWPPGQPWVDNLMTQAIGYRDVNRAMAGAFQASEGGDLASLVVALALGTKATEKPTYLAAKEASSGLREVLKSVYAETGFVCPD